MDVAIAAEAGAAYEALRRRFVGGLPQRRADIFEAGDAHSQHEALHRLAGAAGSYGFAALSHLARRAEAATAADDARLALTTLKAALDGLITAAEAGDTPWKSSLTTPSTTSS